MAALLLGHPRPPQKCPTCSVHQKTPRSCAFCGGPRQQAPPTRLGATPQVLPSYFGPIARSTPPLTPLVPDTWPSTPHTTRTSTRASPCLRPLTCSTMHPAHCDAASPSGRWVLSSAVLAGWSAWRMRQRLTAITYTSHRCATARRRALSAVRGAGGRRRMGAPAARP